MAQIRCIVVSFLILYEYKQVEQLYVVLKVMLASDFFNQGVTLFNNDGGHTFSKYV